jgi:hypothetical protein
MPRDLSSQAKPTSQDNAAEAVNVVSNPSGRLGPGSYALSRGQLLYQFEIRGTAYHKRQDRLLTERMRRNTGLDRKKIKFKGDMGGFVLELMRRRVVEGMEGGIVRANIVKCEGLEEARKMDEVAAVLWLGPGKDVSENGIVENGATNVEHVEEDKEAVASAAEPADFATLDLVREEGRKVPVHNLRRMLGGKHLKKLLEDLPELAGSEVLILRHSRDTINAQMKLWKLHSYVFGIHEG